MTWKDLAAVTVGDPMRVTVQAGSYGTVGYALFPGFAALLILTRNRILKRIMVAIVTLVCIGLVLVDYLHPELIIPYPSAESRFVDLLTTFVPSVFLQGVIVVYFVGNYERVSRATAEQKPRIETLSANLRRYLPPQLAESLENDSAAEFTVPHRKRITIFFSDIKDFTEATDTLRPEDLTQLLNEYLTELTVIATKWGGTIDKFVRDAMMVFFGVPENRGDRAEATSCVRMAVEIQQRIQSLRDKWFNMGSEKPLAIRIGINTGLAAVGDFGAHGIMAYDVVLNSEQAHEKTE